MLIPSCFSTQGSRLENKSLQNKKTAKETDEFCQGPVWRGKGGLDGQRPNMKKKGENTSGRKFGI